MITTIRQRFRTESGEEGSIAVLVAVLVPSALALIGLGVDGGTYVRAQMQAETAASEAARAGAQMLDPGMAMRGQAARLDPGAAMRAARSYLAAAGVEGTVRITGNNEITVTTKVTKPALLLSGNFTGTGEDTATPVRGLDRPQ